MIEPGYDAIPSLSSIFCVRSLRLSGPVLGGLSGKTIVPGVSTAVRPWNGVGCCLPRHPSIDATWISWACVCVCPPLPSLPIDSLESLSEALLRMDEGGRGVSHLST
jgi:hypothetical protein